MSNKLHVYTTKYVFSAIKSLLKELKDQNVDWKTALDSPAGSGALSEFLTEELGLEVVAGEIDPSKWKYPKCKFVELDMNKTLPFQKGTFDLVVCFEGLKHFGYVNLALSEFHRVLKPNGYLVLTIPNDLCVQSRLRYLFDGFVDVDWIKPMDLKSSDEANYMHLNSLVSLPYLYYFLEKAGFQFLLSRHDRLRGWSVLFSVLLYPFIYFAVAKRCARNHPLRSELTSFTWLAGRRNMIVCKKL